MEGREVTHTEKAYCCSNYPQTEATLIAKFDLAFGAILLLSFVITIAVVASKNSPEPVPTQGNNQANLPNHNVTNDLSLILHWPRESQLSALSLLIVGKVVGITLSILLFFGVKQKNHRYLLAWFILTVIIVSFSAVIGVAALILASAKLLLGIYVVGSFLYNWYCLWIVKLLMSEIRAVREGYTNPLDDGEIENANNLVPSSDSFTVDKF